MKRKSLILVVIAALLAVFCNCVWMLPSHACCGSGMSYPAQVERHASSGDQTGDRACCRPQAAIVSMASAFNPVSTDDWVGPSTDRAGQAVSWRLDPRLQPVERRE